MSRDVTRVRLTCELLTEQPARDHAGIIGTHGDLVVVGVNGSLGSSPAADPAAGQAAGQAAAAARHVHTGTSSTTFR